LIQNIGGVTTSRHNFNHPLAGMNIQNSTLIYPNWWRCLNIPGHCPGYITCLPKDTIEKAIMRDLIYAIDQNNSFWAYRFLSHTESMTVVPGNFTINDPWDITLYFTAFNYDGTKTGRYVLPPGWWISKQWQQDGVVVTFVNVSMISILTGQNDYLPRFFISSFNDYHQLTSLIVFVDNFWYPDLQSPPSTTNYTLVDSITPPNRDYYKCMSKRDHCPGYQNPFSSFHNRNDLTYQQAWFSVWNLTVNPAFDQPVELYNKYLSFYAEDALGVSHYLESVIAGGATFAEYFAHIINDSYYTFTELFPGYIFIVEGDEYFFNGLYQSYWGPTGNIFPILAPVWAHFDSNHRISFIQAFTDTAKVFANLQPQLNVNETVFCEIIHAFCVSGYDDQGNYFNNVQFPVTSGPFAGIINTCEQMFNYNITQMPVYNNELMISSDHGYTLRCRFFHLTLAKRGGPGSDLAHIHCPHAGLPKYDPSGNLYPCWDN